MFSVVQRCAMQRLVLVRVLDVELKSLLSRAQSTRRMNKKARNAAMYAAGSVFILGGLSYAAVPLYRMFCAATGYGGTTKVGHDFAKIGTMSPKKERSIRVQFNANVHSLNWSFVPEQDEIVVHPGQTALAFFKAKNLTKRPIVGISTYNIVPYQAGYYFNKVQCFCFEEQLLQPGEEVDMPVFFYLDPDIVDDPALMLVNDIMLSYTFYESKQGLMLPRPLVPENRISVGATNTVSTQLA